MKMLLGIALVALSFTACSSGAQKKSAGGSHDHEDDDHVVTPNSADAHTDEISGNGSGVGDTIEGIPSTNQTPTPTPTPTTTNNPTPTPTPTPTTNCDLSDPTSLQGMSQEQLMECLMQQAGGGGGGLPPGFPTP